MDARLQDVEPGAEEMQGLLMRLMRGINGQTFRNLGNRVLDGPFLGMVIPSHNRTWDDGNSGTKLIGYYEHELVEVIDHAIWRRPNAIINVGCGDGYYAIGLAMKMPTILVDAFDTDGECRLLCEEYAEINKVSDRVKVSYGCDAPEAMLPLNFSGNLLYLMDCEGHEQELIDLDRCPALKNSDIIVECHDFLRDNVSGILADRLSKTHLVNRIKPKFPDFHRIEFIKSTPNVFSVLLAAEKRPMPTCWLACWANEKGIGSAAADE